MNWIKLYIDEDAMDNDLVTALRSRGLTVATALDARLVGEDDERQLVFAAANHYILFTFNVSDFYRLHTTWIEAGREHSGIILAPQQRFSVGEQLHGFCANSPQPHQRECGIRLNSLAIGARDGALSFLRNRRIIAGVPHPIVAWRRGRSASSRSRH